jgi:integrase
MTRKRRSLRVSTIDKYKECYAAHLKRNEDRSIFWLAENLKSIFEELGTRGREGVEKPKPSPAAANKLLQITKNLFEYCRDQGQWLDENPAVNPRTRRTYDKFSLRKREARLSPVEAKRLNAAIQKEREFWRDFFTIVVLTGRRLASVRRLRWDRIDLEAGRIYDRPEDTKNGSANVTEVSETVKAILKKRRADAACDEEWVFPGRRHGEPLQDADNAWNRIRSRANLPELRIHDLRHNAGSWASSEGLGQASIGKYLHHKSPQSTARYTHASVEDSRRVSDSVERVWRRVTAPDSVEA